VPRPAGRRAREPGGDRGDAHADHSRRRCRAAGLLREHRPREEAEDLRGPLREDPPAPRTATSSDERESALPSLAHGHTREGERAEHREPGQRQQGRPDVREDEREHHESRYGGAASHGPDEGVRSHAPNLGTAGPRIVLR
jgi:hypothetical protein